MPPTQTRAVPLLLMLMVMVTDRWQLKHYCCNSIDFHALLPQYWFISLHINWQYWLPVLLMTVQIYMST